MQKLAKREEQIMQAFWGVGHAFIKEVIPLMPEPKPHYNSLATMVKILEEKGFLGHENIVNIYRSFPVISKEEYQNHAMKDIVNQEVAVNIANGFMTQEAFFFQYFYHS